MLIRRQYFDLIEDRTFGANFPKSWKSSSDGGLEIPSITRKCKDCLKADTKACESCEKTFLQYRKLQLT